MSSLSKVLLIFAALLAGAYLFVPNLLAFPAQALLKTIPIWLLGWMAWREAPEKYRLALMLALVFSGIGDFALASPFSLSFAVGMTAFFVAHLFYLWIFTRSLRQWKQLDVSRRTIIILIGLYAVLMGAIVLPKTGELMPAIAAYFLVLSLMAAASFAGLTARWTRLGAVLFVLSDTLIGIDRFVVPLEFRHLAVMASYYAAQAFILAGICWQKPRA